MDRNLTATYTFIIVSVIIVSIIMILATPFGDFIGDAYVSFIAGAQHTMDHELDEGFQEQQEYYNDLLNSNFFDLYKESGLYKADEPESYTPNSTKLYTAYYDKMLYSWSDLAKDNIIISQNNAVKTPYNNEDNTNVATSVLMGDLVLNADIKTIPENAFFNCSNLFSVYFKSVEKVEKKAFYNCSNLRTLYIASQKLSSIEKSAFINTELRHIFYNGTKEEFSNIQWKGSQINLDLTIHCSDGIFVKTI